MRFGNTIYLDHQATTPIDSRVLEEMTPHFGGAFGNPHSADHAVGWRAAKAVDEAAARVAALVGSDPDEIVFTSGATEANNLAILGLGRFAAGGRRRRVLVSAVEHKCVLAAARELGGRCGYSVETLPVDGEGFLDLTALEEAVDDDVLVVSVMAVNNEIGTIQNMEAVSRIVSGRGALLHCDAAQAPAAVGLDGLAGLADLISLSAHKMHGPQGVGGLCVRRDLRGRIEPLIHGGGQQSGLRSGTVPVALCAGFGAAADLVRSAEYGQRREAMRRLRDHFVERLGTLPWPTSLNGPTGDGRHPGNANLIFHGFSAQDILGRLQPGVAASTGAACASGIPEPSHVLRAIGLSDREAGSAIRFSLGPETVKANVDEAVEMIADCLSGMAEAGLAPLGETEAEPA